MRMRGGLRLFETGWGERKSQPKKSVAVGRQVNIRGGAAPGTKGSRASTVYLLYGAGAPQADAHGSEEWSSSPD